MSGQTKKEILAYQTQSGRVPFEEWFNRLKDSSARAVISVYLDRLECGHAGKNRMLQEGVSELRIHVGPGYRVYYGSDGGALIILLCGGDKKSQPKDIQRALEYWQDYKVRR